MALSYQTATEYIASPMYRKASSMPEYFDTDSENKEEITQDPFENIINTIDEEEDDCSDPFSEVDEFLDNESDPFTISDIDPFLLKDVDPFLVDDRDPFYEVDEFDEDEVDPFLVEDTDVFKANSLLDAGVVTDPFLAEHGVKCFEEYDGDDPFLIEDEEYDEKEMHSKEESRSIFELVFTLHNLGLLCLMVALLILLVNHK